MLYNIYDKRFGSNDILHYLFFGKIPEKEEDGGKLDEYILMGVQLW